MNMFPGNEHIIDLVIVSVASVKDGNCGLF